MSDKSPSVDDLRKDIHALEMELLSKLSSLSSKYNMSIIGVSVRTATIGTFGERNIEKPTSVTIKTEI